MTPSAIELERDLEAFLLQGELRFDLLDLGDVGVGADDARRAAVGIPGDRLAAAEDPDVVAVAVAFAILELVVGQHRRYPAALIASRMRSRSSGWTRSSHSFGGRVDLLVGVDAAHDLPHARVERGLGVEVVVPDPLPGAFQGEVPAALAFGERGLGALLPVDIDRLDDRVVQVAGVLVAQRRGRDQHPDRLAVLLQIAPLGAIAVGRLVLQRLHLGVGVGPSRRDGSGRR